MKRFASLTLLLATLTLTSCAHFSGCGCCHKKKCEDKKQCDLKNKEDCQGKKDKKERES